MSIPAILTGSAGRAIEDIMRVRGFASGASYTLRGVAEGRTLAQDATNVFNVLGETRDSLRSTISAARPGLQRSLGSGQRHFSASLQAEMAEVMASRSNLASSTISADRAIQAGTHGASAADDAIALIDDTMPKLQSAARRTAALRVTVGAVGIGGAIAGINHLSKAGQGDGVIIAPGPLGEPGAPDLDRTYV